MIIQVWSIPSDHPEEACKDKRVVALERRAAGLPFDRSWLPERALRLADTLRDLGDFHDSNGLRALGQRIERDFVARGVEVEEHFVHAVIDAASATFGVKA